MKSPAKNGSSAAGVDVLVDGSGPDVAEIRRAFDLLTVPGGVVEIRALHVPVGRGKPIEAAGYFNDMTLAAKAAAALDERGAGGVYLTLNEVKPATFARAPNRIIDHQKPTTGDGDIDRRRWLPLDFDPKRPSGVSSSQDEHCEAQDLARKCAAWLSSLGWPKPIFGDSGNGAHLLYRIDLPADDGGIVEKAVNVIADKMGCPTIDIDRKVFNPARVWKCYGTTAGKGFSIADRPHRVARLVEIPELVETVPVELLQALAAMGKRPEPSRSSTNGNGQPFNHRLDVPRWLTDRGQGFKVKDRPDRYGRTVYILDTCPFDSSHGGSGEVSVMQGQDGDLAAACMHNGCTGKGWQQFKEAIGKPDGNHYDPPYLDHQGNGQAGDSRHDTIDKAGDGKAADTLKPIEFRRISCKELDEAIYDLEYLIDGALVARQPCILAGGKKTLKTSLLIDLGISLATCGYFLGRLKVNRGARVGMMSGESGFATLQETGRRIATAAGYRLADIGGLVWSDQLPQFNSVAHLEAVKRFCMGDELEVLIIDPAYLCVGECDHGNLFEMGQRLQGISRVCEEIGVTLILAHHNKKTGKVDPFSAPELEDIAWSGFQEFARQWLLLGRREPYEPGSGEHRLWLSAGGSVGHSGLWAVDIAEGTRATPGGRFWQVNVMPATEARKDTQARQEETKRRRAEERAAAVLDSDRAAIVKILAKLKTPETKTAIRERVSIGYQRFNRAFVSLTEDGTFQAVELTKGHGKHPYEAWKLRNET